MLEQIIIGLITGLIISLLTGIAIIAFKYPDAYNEKFVKILYYVILYSFIIISTNFFTLYLLKMQTYNYGNDELINNDSVRGLIANNAPNYKYYLLTVLGFLFYIELLRTLPSYLKPKEKEEIK